MIVTLHVWLFCMHVCTALLCPVLLGLESREWHVHAGNGSQVLRKSSQFSCPPFSIIYFFRSIFLASLCFLIFFYLLSITVCFNLWIDIIFGIFSRSEKNYIFDYKLFLLWKMNELPIMYSLVNIEAIFIGWCINISLNISCVYEKIYDFWQFIMLLCMYALYQIC